MGTIPSLEDCKPGVQMTGWRVLVAPETVEEKKGAIFIPDSVRDKEEVVQQRGRIVSIGPAAFDHADYQGREPRVGDAIIFAKLAGFKMEMADGKSYRCIDDKDVVGLIEEAA